VPFLMDVLALRRVPAQFFGVFMSVNPVLAALVGLVMLHQQLDHWAWTAIGVIVTANAVAASNGLRRGRSRGGSSPRVRRSSRRALRAFDPAIRKGCGDEESRSPRRQLGTECVRLQPSRR
jgi:inner membrane transporter RhtA